MLSPQEIARYSKQIILPEFKTQGQEKLRAAKVLVVGAGGLGCPVLQYLTAAGVGALGIVDGDKIDLSNLQRQVLYTAEEAGLYKAEVVASKMSALNPHVQFNVHPVFLDADNALQIIEGYDLLVDGSDNFATRYLINDACVMLNKPMVSGAIYKYEGQVSVFNYKGGPTYRCIFPEPPGSDESPNCADIGVIATLPGIIGSIQANEVIKMITGLGEVLSGKLLVMDTLTMQTHLFRFNLIETNKNITALKVNPSYCEPTIQLIDYPGLQEMIKNPDVQLIDVREKEEHVIDNIGGINIPLSVFDEESHSLDKKQTIILYCSSGVRSKHSAKLLLQKGFTKLFNLNGGMNSISVR